MKKILCFVLAAVCVFTTACVLPANDYSNDVFAAGETEKAVVPINDIAAVYIETDRTIVVDEYRACSIKIVDVYGNTVEDAASKIKVRGNSTSSGAKKPYNFKLSSKTELLGMGKAKKWCLLANCYEKTLIRNEMVFDFARNATCLQYTPDSRFVDVYLNGVLQGNYILCEAVEAGSSRVDIDIDNGEFLLERDVREEEGTVYLNSPVLGIRFALNEPEEPTAEQLNSLNAFLRKAENALSSGKMSEIEKYFDIPSIVDFYIILEYFKQVDISVGSTRFYIKDGKIYGGPVWDFDLTMGNCLSSYYTAYNNVGGSGKSCEGIYCNVDWFRYFNKVAEFQKLRNDRFLELQDSIVKLYTRTVNGISYIDTVTAENSASFARNYKEAKWKIDIVYSTLERIPEKTYEGNLGYLRTWLKERNEWLLTHWGLTQRNYVVPEKASGMKADGGIIYGLKAGVTPKKCEDMFVFNATVTTEYEFVGTGSTVRNEGVTYGFVVLGDVDGNGVVDARDYIRVRRDFLGTYDIEGLCELSADCNGDGKISATDYLMVRRHIVGNLDLYE